MLNRFKNLKIVKKLQEMSPKLKWLEFSKMQDKKSHDYIGMITSDAELKSLADNRRLEAMVREQLKAEFPNIENSKSYEVLVDAVITRIKNKQLQATDDMKFDIK